MKTKLIIALASVVALTSALASADANDTNVTRVRVGGSYVELRTLHEACPGAGIGDWSFRPRIDYGSAPHIAEGVQSVALAALLSGKKVDLATTVSGGRCHISAIMLEGT